MYLRVTPKLIPPFNVVQLLSIVYCLYRVCFKWQFFERLYVKT